MPFSKLTKGVHDKLVELMSSGCPLSSAAAAIGIHPGSVRRWLFEGKDPVNRRQRALRLAIKKARAEAEIKALQNIQTAGLDEKHWQSNAWYLQNVVQKKYLKNARLINQPQVNVSMADIARELEQEEESNHESNGYTDNVPEMITDRMEGYDGGEELNQG